MELVEDGEDRWRIPRSGGMLVDGLIFASEKLIVMAPEEQALGSGRDLECSEDNGALRRADRAAVPEKAKSRGAPQLGSLGAGNHFIEVQLIDEVFSADAAEAMELFAGQVCVMIHTGS